MSEPSEAAWDKEAGSEEGGPAGAGSDVRADVDPAPAEEARPDGSSALPVVDVHDADWEAIAAAVREWSGRSAAHEVIQAYAQAGGEPPPLAFDRYRASPDDRTLVIPPDGVPRDLWFVGDLHGDLLALEAALHHIFGESAGRPTIVLLGDLFDDGRYAFEVVARVLSLLLGDDADVTVLAGNHDEALRRDGAAFRSDVSPSDFTDWLNERLDDPMVGQLGDLIVRLFASAPRALFFPDGLLAAHAGVPHTDLHAMLQETGDWNNPRVLQDFVWTRAHPRARRKLPNRSTRGCQFGREDFEAFCSLATRLGRPVERMIRGHDHVDERFEVYPLYERNPMLTINTLSHQLPREVFGPYERVPCVARALPGRLPQVHRLHLPAELIRDVYPEPGATEEAGEEA